jgi:hypothetical protein
VHGGKSGAPPAGRVRPRVVPLARAVRDISPTGGVWTVAVGSPHGGARGYMTAVEPSAEWGVRYGDPRARASGGCPAMIAASPVHRSWGRVAGPSWRGGAAPGGVRVGTLPRFLLRILRSNFRATLRP